MKRKPSKRRSELSLPFRQIHLDFHTSEHITNIGDRFDPDEFADTLQRAHVNSVTCFARCHHGYIYFDTKRFPERRHPHLNRNLLEEQIEACHKRNIRVPIYTTVQWDHYTAHHHPEWICLQADGSIDGTPPYEAGFYRYLCVNTPYRRFLKEHIEELFDVLPVDGLFLDIVKPRDCSCYFCRSGMEAAKLNPCDQRVREQYGLEVLNDFMSDISRFIRKLDKHCFIFYNGGHVGPRHRAVIDHHSHLELESLPSGGWGYMHFPLTVRYARKLTEEYLGMTGKFHTSWGDFHSFKNLPALQFECFTMLAMGAKCSVGDQLHPRGKICNDTYDFIGSVYADVERKEPWCVNAIPMTEIAVLSPEEFVGGRRPAAAIGAVRILQEGAHQFDILDTKHDFSDYKVLVLPDVITVSDELAHRIEEFLANGGSLIASYRSGLGEEQNLFNLRALNLQLVGEAPFSPDFVVPKGKIGAGLKKTEHVMYLRGMEVKPTGFAKILAYVNIPYFNRTYAHFCSHLHTPSSGKRGYPAVVQNGNAIYFAHPVFTQYNENAPVWCKQLVLNALDSLWPEPVVRIKAPSHVIATVNEQPDTNRWILHLLSYIPEQRGEEFCTIEDVIPLHDIHISMKLPRKIERVVAVPENEPIDFKVSDDRVEFLVPRLVGHQMISLA